jgi:uncharacterized membrane protein
LALPSLPWADHRRLGRYPRVPFGAAGGALGGKMADVGVDDDFVKNLGAKMPAGGAALIALGQTDARDKLLDRIGHYGGHVIQTSLSGAEEAQLRTALGEGAPA